MNRHEYRVKIVFALYQSLLLKKDLKASFDDSFNEDSNDYLLSLRNDLESHYQDYIYDIAPLLKNWTFDRLSYLDQAILIEAASEIKMNLNDKNIVIDEAIRIAKEYSDPDSYKYINGVLDNL